MDFWSSVTQVFNALFSCSHVRARVTEGKTYCPECGKGIICRWVVIKCAGCGQRRPTQYRFRQVVPAEACCTHCGEHETAVQVLQDPEFYQLHHALLSFEAEESDVSLLQQVSVYFPHLLKDSLNTLRYRYHPSPRTLVHLPSSLSF